MLAKFTPTLRTLESLASRDDFALVAPVIRDQVIEGVKELSALETQCKAVINTGSGQMDHDVKTITIKVAALKRTSTMALQVLALNSRASALVQ